MGRSRSVPSYRLHKPSGQAIVTLRAAGGTSRMIYLGKFDSPESKQEYARIVAELAASPVKPAVEEPAGVWLITILDLFDDYAKSYFRRPDGTNTTEWKEYRRVIQEIRGLYSDTKATDFGPLALKAVRQKWIDAGHCRSTINTRTQRVKRIFKWAVAEELIPVEVYQALLTVPGLKKGRTPVREPEPIKPVPAAVVDATLPYLNSQVRGMVELHRLCGGRPEDICNLRLADIDRTRDVWEFRPSQHKNAYRGLPRVIALGPKAQAIILKFAPADNPDAYVFGPARAVEERHRLRGELRKTPRWPSHMARNVNKRVASPKRPPAARYTSHSYARAITRAIKLANADRCRGPNYRPPLPPVPHWAPNQLRHSVGTEVRARFGLEASQVILGHARADVTQVYAERNLELARKVAKEMG